MITMVTTVVDRTARDEGVGLILNPVEDPSLKNSIPVSQWWLSFLTNKEAAGPHEALGSEQIGARSCCQEIDA